MEGGLKVEVHRVNTAWTIFQHLPKAYKMYEFVYKLGCNGCNHKYDFRIVEVSTL